MAHHLTRGARLKVAGGILWLGAGVTRNSGRNSDGAFSAGNPGKPKGTRHKATVAALRLCLERIAPPRRDAPFTCPLPPMQSAGDAAKAAGAVLGSVADGELSPIEGALVMVLVDAYRRTLEATELEARRAHWRAAHGAAGAA
jgi:hypothetical protein